MKLKEKIIAVAIVIGMMPILSLEAQTYGSGSVTSSVARFGIRGGMNFSALDPDDAEMSDLRKGYTVGLFAKLHITPLFAIMPEVNYTTKGGAIHYNEAFVDGTAAFDVNYVEVPILLVLQPAPFLNFHAGPYFAQMVGGSVSNVSEVSLFNFEDEIDPDDYNRFDAGFAAGGALDAGPFSVGFRYTQGLKKVGKERTYDGNSYIFPNANNRVYTVYMSLALF